jgi:hypothetical protein
MDAKAHFDRVAISDFTALLNSYSIREFASPYRSTIPLLSLIKDGQLVLRDILARVKGWRATTGQLIRPHLLQLGDYRPMRNLRRRSKRGGARRNFVGDLRLRRFECGEKANRSWICNGYSTRTLSERKSNTPGLAPCTDSSSCAATLSTSASRGADAYMTSFMMEVALGEWPKPKACPSSCIKMGSMLMHPVCLSRGGLPPRCRQQG